MVRTSRFPFAYGLYSLRLAAWMNSLARVSRRMPRPCLFTLSEERDIRGFQALALAFPIRFQALFTPLPGCFSAFPRGTSSLSVSGRI